LSQAKSSAICKKRPCASSMYEQAECGQCSRTEVPVFTFEGAVV
jgi:hypothetical protein